MTIRPKSIGLILFLCTTAALTDGRSLVAEWTAQSPYDVISGMSFRDDGTMDFRYASDTFTQIMSDHTYYWSASPHGGWTDLEILQVRDDGKTSGNPTRFQVTFFAPGYIELQEFVLLANGKDRRLTEWKMRFQRQE